MEYFRQARIRASRRKSRWNLLLIPACFGTLIALCAASVALLLRWHAVLHPGESFLNSRGIGPFLTMIAPFLGWLPVAFLVGNWFVRLVSRAREALDREALGHTGASYRSSQAALARLARWSVPFASAAGVFGASLAW